MCMLFVGLTGKDRRNEGFTERIRSTNFKYTRAVLAALTLIRLNFFVFLSLFISFVRTIVLSLVKYVHNRATGMSTGALQLEMLGLLRKNSLLFVPVYGLCCFSTDEVEEHNPSFCKVFCPKCHLDKYTRIYRYYFFLH